MSDPDAGRSMLSRCKEFYGRIHSLNPELHAYSELLEASAIEIAGSKDRQALDDGDVGPLFGLAGAIKDNIDTVPAAARAGLRFLDQNRPGVDSTVVKLLRKSGAVILGVTETDAGAFGVTTPRVKNPAYSDRYAGGSSGGSGAAVAAGLCDFAIGTDTGGSVRIPAACCGVYGFKPTVDTVSLHGIRRLTRSYDHIGPLARSMDLIERVMQVLSKPSKTSSEDRARTIGIPRASLGDCDPAVLHALEDFEQSLESSGLAVREISFPSIDDLLDIHVHLSLREAADLYHDVPKEQERELPDLVSESLKVGNSVDPSKLAELERRKSVLMADVHAAVQSVDYVVLPTLPILPPKRSTNRIRLGANHVDLLSMMIRFTAIFNQTGHPVLSFPWIRSGAVIHPSLQLIGPKDSDLSLLSFARTRLGLPRIEVKS